MGKMFLSYQTQPNCGHSDSQRKSGTCEGIQLSWLECHVDIVKVTGSSPVMPIRQNKKRGKEMRMSACLTQPTAFVVCDGSQRNFTTCVVDKSRKIEYNNM